MAHLIPCGACARHVRATDAACPFCRAPVAPSTPPAMPTERLSRAALFVFGAAISGAACVPTENAPQPVVNTAPPIPPPHVVVVTEPSVHPTPISPPHVVVTPQPDDTTAAPAYGAAPPVAPPEPGSFAARYGLAPRPRPPRPGSISTRYGSPPSPDFE